MHYLHSSTALLAAPPGAARELMQQLGGANGARPSCQPTRILLASEQRNWLVSLLDNVHANALGKTEDLRMTVLPKQLEDVLGEETVRSLAVAYAL